MELIVEMDLDEINVETDRNGWHWMQQMKRHSNMQRKSLIIQYAALTCTRS